MALSPGDKLGPYQVLSALGAGGMGEVWKARDTRLDRIVAIKQLKGQHSARFEQEARSIAALNHPHICQIYDVGPDYLVMECVEGKPLSGPLPVEEAVQFAVQIASALEDAHAKGILHRDLKPANILVTSKGSAKLLDFGLAKLMSDTDADATQTLEGTVLGSPAYMSPEQAQGKTLDERSDIFSFGAVLYELLSGKRPFSGGSTVEVLSAVLRDEPARLDAPESVAAIVRRCMAKRAADRFGSTRELLKALRQSASKSDAQASIAVLPFANMSRDADDEYFSDGLAEEIINALVKVPGLKVIARTSAFSFKGQNIDIRKIAETLGVNTVLEGSVRRAGSRIRVTAQLITAADGTHLWSERYDREMADIFAVQDEIAAAISEALQMKLSPTAASKQGYTPKLPAYEALLKAKHFHWKVTAESMEQAQEFYQQAIALDPQYALAHAAYADYLFGRTTVGMSTLREVAPLAQSLAQRALELDPALPSAHVVVGMFSTFTDFDWKRAESAFWLATMGDAATPHCHMSFGLSLLAAGRREEAVQQLEKAVQMDPLQITIRALLGHCLGAVGRFSEAEEQFRQTIQLDSNHFWAYVYLAALYVVRGRFTEALSIAEEGFSVAPWYPPSIGIYAGILTQLGQVDRGKELLQELGSGERSLTSAGWALFHICCGEIDSAADWYERVIEERDPIAIETLQTAIGEPVRSSPRWPKLAAMMNLPAKSSLKVI